MDVLVGTGLAVDVMVGVGDGVALGVDVMVGVSDGVALGVDVGVLLWVGAGVLLGNGVTVRPGVEVMFGVSSRGFVRTWSLRACSEPSPGDAACTMTIAPAAT